VVAIALYERVADARLLPSTRRLRPSAAGVGNWPGILRDRGSSRTRRKDARDFFFDAVLRHQRCPRLPVTRGGGQGTPWNEEEVPGSSSGSSHASTEGDGSFEHELETFREELSDVGNHFREKIRQDFYVLGQELVIELKRKKREQAGIAAAALEDMQSEWEEETSVAAAVLQEEPEDETPVAAPREEDLRTLDYLEGELDRHETRDVDQTTGPSRLVDTKDEADQVLKSLEKRCSIPPETGKMDQDREDELPPVVEGANVTLPDISQEEDVVARLEEPTEVDSTLPSETSREVVDIFSESTTQATGVYAMTPEATKEEEVVLSHLPEPSEVDVQPPKTEMSKERLDVFSDLIPGSTVFINEEVEEEENILARLSRVQENETEPLPKLGRKPQTVHLNTGKLKEKKPGKQQEKISKLGVTIQSPSSQEFSLGVEAEWDALFKDEAEHSNEIDFLVGDTDEGEETVLNRLQVLQDEPKEPVVKEKRDGGGESILKPTSQPRKKKLKKKKKPKNKEFQDNDSTSSTRGGANVAGLALRTPSILARLLRSERLVTVLSLTFLYVAIRQVARIVFRILAGNK
jgi:hypothetical protein